MLIYLLVIYKVGVVVVFAILETVFIYFTSSFVFRDIETMKVV